MGSVRLKLRGNKIYLHVNYGFRKQKRYASGYALVHSKNWDLTNSKVRNVSSEPRSTFINAQLTSLVSIAEQLLDDCTRNNTPITNELIKATLDVATSKTHTVAKRETSLLQFYKWFIDHYEINSHPKTNSPLANGTIRTYKTALKKLTEYNNTIQKIDFNDITLEFHQNYTKHLQLKNHSNNYIGNQFKQLKAIMNASLERNLHNNQDFKKTSFSKITEKVNDIYLTNQEIQTLEVLDLKHDGERRARDLFLIQCYTGMRVGDLKQLTSKNLKETKDNVTYLEYVQSKTGKTVQIPLSKKFIELIDYYGGEFPRIMSDQKINEYLKCIGEKAELNEEIIKEKTIRGSRRKTTMKKKDILTNHTARRSFCTNAYLAGMSTIDIMAMSGHSSETVFYRYIKVTPNERLQRLSKHKFFQ